MKIKKEVDAFGMEIMAHYNGDEVTEIIERSDGYIDGYENGIAKYFGEYKNWSYATKQAMKNIKGKTLDLGCGAGRIGLYLQNKKIDYLGIDNSPLAVKVCKLRGLKRVKILPIENLNNLKEKNFKSVTMLGNNFGLLGTPKRGKKILEELHKITTCDANIIAQSCDISKTKNIFHIAYQKDCLQKGKLRGELKLRCRFGNIKGPWFDYLMVTQKEMEMILNGTGWKIQKIINEKTGPLYCAVISKV
ncbi:MAG: hypothetical protein A2504_12895 [Bdellovibrionales bacterium RIFOXYD12_FULL_39_22]|nr:MAG: hypothetical protein A2385_11970 [Bdellovibrionales bacterium RIFOXYB1_FULL_39_21]OFZ48941.1 MAG: hypothetical protein A2404_14180 [Bdellovibrionales bacterium RIFOXYC1_FULL_39_130]OFZ69899.1 MAG: hypothetical protein A2451_01265 [Bdellovibrionales bacterium RIFOXYC2_FULL_39_8]OFZ77637.1 MAG: hypothetical protein A2560_04740 [Bdellovibrionales bacterium RIFOXYD1_FULL_39_84]OFZ96091.1 MAG: hypothetical protein A2504_12895 [Bdellovibrionales bacterium RIFOXYD12_FULL_39_22]HLE11630.1 meth